MEKILIMDAKDYDENTPEIYRTSSRGIIIIDGKLLLIENDFGEVKIPGGCSEGEESELETLIREVKEETGYRVIPESVVPFGIIEEKRMSVKEPMIWHHMNYMYFCQVEQEPGECTYTEHEKAKGYKPVFLTVEEALQKIEAVIEKEGAHVWNRREYNTMKLVKEYLERRI